MRVSQISSAGCVPLPGAQVDLWHCDALGVYSGTTDPGFNTVGQKFLRGYQVTDENGAAQFTTLYPGWYQGRTVHIHFKIRTDPNSDAGAEFTSQLFFDDSITDQVHAQQPYASKGQRTLRNDGDGIFRGGRNSSPFTDVSPPPARPALWARSAPDTPCPSRRLGGAWSKTTGA